jgi:hypothetical protein
MTIDEHICPKCGYAGPLLHTPDSTACKKRQADCQIDGQGFCRTHQRVHLRERAVEMGIPAAAERCQRISDEEADGRSTVAHEWNMRCPQCKSDESIDISAIVYVRLKPEGTDIADAHNGDHDWDNDSTAYCAACGFAGTVRAFEIDKEGEKL